MYKITIDNNLYFASTDLEVDKILSEIKNLKSTEIWLEVEENKLCILINEERAFFMILEGENGTNYISFDKEECEELNEDFLLSNGQLDEYPRNMTKDKSYVTEVAKFFLQYGEKYDKIDWAKG